MGYFVVTAAADVGQEDVFYPSSERLAADLASIGYTMPESGLVELEEYLAPDGWARFSSMVRAALRIYAAAADWVKSGDLSLDALGEVEACIVRAIAAW